MNSDKLKDSEEKIKLLTQQLELEQSKNGIFNSILEGGTLIFWSVDRNYQLTAFNQNYFNTFMTNIADSRLFEWDGDELIECDEKEFWDRKYKQALEGKSLDFEIKLLQDKKEFWKEIFLNPVYEKNGEIKGVSGLANDITDKMRSQLALVESERKFRNIFQSFQDVYFRCNFNGKITMLSPSVYDIIGYSEKEMIGKNITDYYLYKSKTKSLLRQLTVETRIRNFEIEAVHKEGRIIPFICNVRLIYNQKMKPIYIEGVAREITELKETNQQLIEAKELAEESLKIKERFLANMSHEIRTPLNGIIGTIHLLDEPGISEDRRKHIISLKNSSEILLNILNDLLDMSKIEAGKMTLKNQPVSTLHLLEKALSLYQEQAKIQDIELNYFIGSKVPEYIFSDETKLIQIYANLISNALKFTPHGGKIDVELSLKKLDITGEAILQGKVSDNGIGIDPQEHGNLFKSFTQLDSSSKKSYKGTGLGLYITKQLVELFNGEISVESNRKKGSTFTFTFETTRTRIRPQEKKYINQQISGQPNILVVDDNEINLDIAASILQKAGCNVSRCNGGKKCLGIVEDKVFDAILMDIQMPDVDGIMATKMIRSKLTSDTPPIIAMTAYSMEGDEEKFLRSGFDDYIAKPIKPELLIVKLSKWLNKTLEQGETEQKQSDNSQISTIDLKVLEDLERFGGKEMVEEALNEFDQECDRQLIEAKDSFAQKNYQEVLNILHTLKGNAGTLGIIFIAKKSEELESELKKENYIIFEKEIGELIALQKSFKKDLNILVNKNQ